MDPDTVITRKFFGISEENTRKSFKSIIWKYGSWVLFENTENAFNIYTAKIMLYYKPYYDSKQSC